VEVGADRGAREGSIPVVQIGGFETGVDEVLLSCPTQCGLAHQLDTVLVASRADRGGRQ
jgi:hypothetical protein